MAAGFMSQGCSSASKFNIQALRLLQMLLSGFILAFLIKLLVFFCD